MNFFSTSSVSSGSMSSLPLIAVPGSGGNQTGVTSSSPGFTISPLTPTPSSPHLASSITPITPITPKYVRLSPLSPESPESIAKFAEAQAACVARRIQPASFNQKLIGLRDECRTEENTLERYRNLREGTGPLIPLAGRFAVFQSNKAKLQTQMRSIQEQPQPTSQGSWSIGGVLHRITHSLLPSAQGIARTKAVVRVLLLSAAALVTMALTSSPENSYQE